MQSAESFDAQDKQMREALVVAANGDVEALDFLHRWVRYCHCIDDVVDEGWPGTERFLGLMVQAHDLYTAPFYQKHISQLKLLVYQVTSMYADSVKLEESVERNKRRLAAVLSGCGIEMVLAVAGICGGYNLQRALSGQLRVWIYEIDAADRELER